MFELVTLIGESVFLNLLQIGIGCVIAIVIYKIGWNKTIEIDTNHFIDMALIIAFSLLGIILPIGIYGIIPIVSALIFIGFKEYVVVPIVFSNSLFNTLVPYSDPSFIWKTGILRVGFAFSSGIIIGLIFKVFRSRMKNSIKSSTLTVIETQAINLRNLILLFLRNVEILGKYLLIGITIDVIFHKYILFQSFSLFDTNHYLSLIPKFFSTHDVVNPYFLITMLIARMFLDLTKMSGIIAILNNRGLFRYFAYFIVLATLLSSSAFF
jgi:uncharacterized membrane protein YraQ (UPF0718 family)